MVDGKSSVSGTAPPRVAQKGKTKKQPSQRKSKKIKDLKEPEELNEIKISARKTKYALLQQIHVFSQLCSLSIKDVSDLSSAYKQLHGCMIEELKLTLASNKVELDDDEQSDEDYDNMPSADLIALVSNIKKDLR